MKLIVKLFGNLRRHLPPNLELLELDVAPGMSVDDVIRELKVNAGEVGLAVVNGELVEETALLHEGDKLELFAVVGGGAPRR